jgi:hypothetical protein
MPDWKELHYFDIDGAEYVIVAQGHRQWFYKGDRVSFEWEW